MADISVAANATVPSTNAVIDRRYPYGDATVGTAGTPVYLDDTTMSWKRADANNTVLASGTSGLGFLLNGTANNQPAAVLVAGDIQFNAALVTGEVYCVSSNDGRFAPIADLVAGMYSSILGIAISTTTMRVNPLASGAIHA